MDNRVNRRCFLRRIGCGALGLFCIPYPAMAALVKEKKSIFTLKPYWLDTLSRGPRHWPHNAKISIPSGATDNDLKSSAYEILRTSSLKNRAVKRGRKKRTDLLMDNIVLGYKKSQYLFWQINPDYQYRCTDFMEDIFFDEDPVLGKIMKDLSRMILDYIDQASGQANFERFNPYQETLLNAAMEYALEGVGVYEKVLQKTFDSHKPMVRKSLAEAYNYYGLALNYLEREAEAVAAFNVALQLSPTDLQASQ